jgi:hypothetical protein
MKTEQTIFRLYPDGYTGNSLKELQVLLSNGWHVKFITPSLNGNNGKIINDYVLEREIERI